MEYLADTFGMNILQRRLKIYIFGWHNISVITIAVHGEDIVHPWIFSNIHQTYVVLILNLKVTLPLHYLLITGYTGAFSIKAAL